MIRKMVRDIYILNYIVKASPDIQQRMPVGSLLNGKATRVDISILTGNVYLGGTYHGRNMLIYRNITYTLDFN